MTRPKSIAEAFIRAAQRFPSRPALISPHDSSVGHPTITYSRLLSVVRHSAKKSFKDGQVIVVGIEEGYDLVAVELAAWLAGAAVCPFDVRRDPRSRDVISLLNPDLVVIANNDDTIYSFPNVDCQKASEIIDWDQAEVDNGNEVENMQLPSEDSLSHLVFTSGTTGLPKCVGVTNKSLLMFAKAKTSCSEIDENSRIFLASSFTFDPQLGDIACALSAGACLILPQRNALLSGMLGSLLTSSQATHVCTTPAALSMISGQLDFQYLQEILVGGEKMPPALVERLLEECKRTGTRLVNTYGVTECCVYQAIKPVVKRGDESYLGSAYPGAEILLVQFNNSEIDPTSWRVCGPGEEGEIIMRGPLLGIGYLSSQQQQPVDETNNKRPRGMTALFEKRDGFVKNFYRTGDIGVLDQISNEIMFLGRRDSQFKVNGIRIEAGEVEHALETKAGSMYSKAIALNPGGKLVACGVLNLEDAKMLGFSRGCCRLPNCVSVCLGRHLSKVLPDAYVPSAYFAVESIPVAATGKVDRKRLEALVAIAVQESSKHKIVEMDDSNDLKDKSERGKDEIELALQSQESSNSANQALTVLEKFLANVWCDILGLSSVEPIDNFRELGGDSLVALKGINMLLTKLREYTMTIGRDQVHPSLVEAMDEAQKYGEIEGPFSAVALLTSANLRSYAGSLLPFLKGLQSFQVDELKPSGNEDDDVIDIEPEEDPTLLKALMDASTLGLPQTIRAILQLGTVSSDGRFVPRKRMCRAPLHNASQTGSVDAIRVLAGEFSARVMCVTTARVSPLHLPPTVPALLELVKFARQQRSDVRPMAVEDKNQQTPIHFAARLGRSDCIRAFVEEQLGQATPPNRNLSNKELVRKTINGLDKWRRTPLHWAVVNGHNETVKVLLELGAVAKHLGLKLGQPGPNSHLPQETALELALRRGASAELVEILREAETHEEAARRT